MPAWEYKVEKVKTGGMVTPNLNSAGETFMNRIGSEGWELVSIVPLPRGGGTVEQVYFYFKRLRDPVTPVMPDPHPGQSKTTDDRPEPQSLAKNVAPQHQPPAPQAEESQGKLIGLQASTPSGRLELLEVGLGGLSRTRERSFMVLSVEGSACYIQFESSSSSLRGEVGSNDENLPPVERPELGVLSTMGFHRPDDSNINYYRDFEQRDVRAVAEIVELLFMQTLGCPASFVLEIVDFEGS